MAELTTLESLLEMGFGRNRVERAVANTGNQGIERAMDWLMEHEDDPDIDEPYVQPVGNILGEETTNQSSTEPSSLVDTTEETYPDHLKSYLFINVFYQISVFLCLVSLDLVPSAVLFVAKK
uniref:UBX domain protein 1 n=1 Tax=Cynoglossus semilaevis TaxID=244447 RepID=A0A3P8V236_CYNSE